MFQLGHGGFGTVFLAKQRRGLMSLANQLNPKLERDTRHHDQKYERDQKREQKKDQKREQRSKSELIMDSSDLDYIESLDKANRLVVLKKVAVTDITDADSIALEGRRLAALRHQNMVCI